MPVKPTEQQRGSASYLAGMCFVASLGGLLFGFDTAVISGTVERVTGQFGLTDLQQGWFTSAALIGCIVEAAIAGWLGDRFGRKPNLMVAAESALRQPDSPFAEQYARGRNAGLAYQNARRNVARSLSGTLWGMWKSGERYRPEWVGRGGTVGVESRLG